MRKGLLYFLLCFCLSFAGKYDRQIKTQKSKLIKMKKELKKYRKKVKDMERQKEGVLMSLSAIAKSLNKSKSLLNEMKTHEQLQIKSLDMAQKDLDSFKLREQLQQDKLSQRVVYLYKNGRSAYIGLLKELLAKPAVLTDLPYWKAILKQDKNLITEVRQLQESRFIAQKEILVRLESIKSTRADREKQTSELAQEEGDQRKILKDVQSNQKLLKKALKERESNQKVLMTLLKRLEKKAAQSKRKKKKRIKGTTLKGKKCWPTKGKIISSFGLQRHKQLKTLTKNLGIEIKAKLGNKVKSAAAGKVVLITKLQGRGRAVIVEHSDLYFSVYGHLSSILVKEGQKLGACQTLGRVGDEESIDGAKLYFQVSHGTETEDPKLWLNQAK